ncbi:hypothetical protein ACI3L3_05955 [Desulfobaculum sp. SPO524]|uniref:hypothetical protein n=1 Tax=Desulfobaculum sp. SPO524 TaxID=3378071 RepID=UPI003854D2AA
MQKKCCRCNGELGEWSIYVETERGPICGDCIVTEGLRVARPEQRRNNVVPLTRERIVLVDDAAGWGAK